MWKYRIIWRCVFKMPYKDKNKQNEYQLNWWRKRRQEFFRDKKCEICNSTNKLVLHHKNPKSKKSHSIWSWSQKRREAEVKKCTIWCEKCHRKYHAKKLKVPVIHGTRSGYDKGCRCDNCKDFKRTYDTYRRSLLKKYGVDQLAKLKSSLKK